MLQFKVGFFGSPPFLYPVRIEETMVLALLLSFC